MDYTALIFSEAYHPLEPESLVISAGEPKFDQQKNLRRRRCPISNNVMYQSPSATALQYQCFSRISRLSLASMLKFNQTWSDTFIELFSTEYFYCCVLPYRLDSHRFLLFALFYLPHYVLKQTTATSTGLNNFSKEVIRSFCEE